MELETIRLKDCDRDFVKDVIAAGGKKAQVCFQCGTCTAGCPTVYAMDYTPRQIMRMVNLGMKEQVLKSDTIWLCASCFTCQTRCPRGVEITSVMGALKSIAIKEGIDVANKKGPIFNNSFIEVAMKHGRMFEPMLLLKFAGGTEGSIPGAVKTLMKDAPLGMGLVKRGKMAFLPQKIRKPEQLKTIYENIRRMEGEAQ
ncbi:MAG: 4Fe-4S dicluster domain-containing protein [Candidatus Hydrothermarchaeaceae archaeon]